MSYNNEDNYKYNKMRKKMYEKKLEKIITDFIREAEFDIDIFFEEDDDDDME